MDDKRQKRTREALKGRIDDVLAVPRSGDELDLRGKDIREILKSGETPKALERREFRKVRFGDRDREADPASLTDARFGESLFENVAFANVDLTRVYFRGCIFRGCDFRYARLQGTSFQEAHFEKCEFYRAYFQSATVFTDAQLECVSFDKAWMAGIVGLRAKMFHGKAMAQECDETEYNDFLQATRDERPSSHTIEEALDNATLDVAEVYRALSGMWTSQGQLADAGIAYVKCKNLERAHYRPANIRNRDRKREQRNKKRAEDRSRLEELDESDRQFAESENEPRLKITWSDRAKWARLTFAWALADYGESIKRVAIWVAGLIVFPAIVYGTCGGVEIVATKNVDHDLSESLLFSLQALTDSSHSLQASTPWFELLASIQFLLGVALLGLLGFTVANRLRNA